MIENHKLKKKEHNKSDALLGLEILNVFHKVRVLSTKCILGNRMELTDDKTKHKNSGKL